MLSLSLSFSLSPPLFLGFMYARLALNLCSKDVLLPPTPECYAKTIGLSHHTLFTPCEGSNPGFCSCKVITLPMNGVTSLAL